MHKFGEGSGAHSFEDNPFCTVQVKWMGLRPSQLENLTTSGHQEARTLTRVIKKLTSVFSIKKSSRLERHINEETSWIANGVEERKAYRKGEMEAMQKLGKGIDVESAEDDQVIELILKSILKIWAGQDEDDVEYAYV